jgi:uncharacterized membrane protein YkoI
MDRKTAISAAFAVMLLAGTMAGCSHAWSADKDANDATLLQQAKITLTEAISTAEQKTGAKATEATVDEVNGVPTFKVMVVKDQAVQKVLIDAQTGQVLKVAAADKEGEGEEEEDGDGNE